MSMPIAIFYHCLFALDRPDNILDSAVAIVQQQMDICCVTGLAKEAAHFLVGINGGEESKAIAELVLPRKATKVYHGLESHAENLTLVELEKWLPEHPGWNVLYFHAKGCTHSPGQVADSRALWRDCMMRNLVGRWQRCVSDLYSGFESVGCHWMEPPATPASQFIWAGNFWWAKSDFLRTLPSITKRARIIESGIGAAESRYEAEVWLGNGPRPPIVKDYHPNWNPSKVATCPYT